MLKTWLLLSVICAFGLSQEEFIAAAREHIRAIETNQREMNYMLANPGCIKEKINIPHIRAAPLEHHTKTLYQIRSKEHAALRELEKLMQSANLTPEESYAHSASKEKILKSLANYFSFEEANDTDRYLYAQAPQGSRLMDSYQYILTQIKPEHLQKFMTHEIAREEAYQALCKLCEDHRQYGDFIHIKNREFAYNPSDAKPDAWFVCSPKQLILKLNGSEEYSISDTYIPGNTLSQLWLSTVIAKTKTELASYDAQRALEDRNYSQISLELKECQATVDELVIEQKGITDPDKLAQIQTACHNANQSLLGLKSRLNQSLEAKNKLIATREAIKSKLQEQLSRVGISMKLHPHAVPHMPQNHSGAAAASAS